MTVLNNNETRNKIKTLEQLADIVSALRADEKKTVHCHGVFDLLHIGHIRHFEQARKMGDILVVTITPDRFVNKGPYHPAFTEYLRAEAIAALDCVDYVSINNMPTAMEVIKLLKPDIYVKGSDYKDAQDDVTGKIVDEENAIKSVGGEIAFTDDVVFSSSSLINQYLSVLPDEVREYLSAFSKQFSEGDILKYLKNAQSHRVLIVGEAIIDEYQYCSAIGKSSKEPILAMQYLSSEKFAGGVLAVANHVSNFCGKVDMLTMLGEESSQEDFVRQNMNSSVNNMFIYKADSPTIVKRRFIEGYLLQKLFEVYEMNDEGLNQAQDLELCAKLEEIITEYDVVIVVDYGHGMMTNKAISLLAEKARFLAVNTQANAANKGFNTISRYPRADYICLAQHEIELEERKRNGDIKKMIHNLSEKVDCNKITVTRSKLGNICYSEADGFIETPAFTDQVVDRMGAGDAVISLTSLCVAQQAPMAIVGFIGNVVGAQAVATLGHKSSIDRTLLFKSISTLLK